MGIENIKRQTQFSRNFVWNVFINAFSKNKTDVILMTTKSKILIGNCAYLYRKYREAFLFDFSNYANNAITCANGDTMFLKDISLPPFSKTCVLELFSRTFQFTLHKS